MDLKDRFTRGFIAGAAAGILQDVIDYVLYLLRIVELRYLDWAAIILFRHEQANGFSETSFALVAELFFSGILGIAFAYLIPRITSRNYFFKGWLYGVTVWFAIYSIMVLFQVRGLHAVDFSTAVADFITSSVYGLALAAVLLWLDKTSGETD